MRLPARALLASTILLALTAHAPAWDEPAHEIIATLALQKLNPKARAAVADAAREISSPGHPYDSISLACWMDDIRQDRTMPFGGKFATWHFIDLGVEPGDPAPSLTPGDDNPMHGDAIQALKRAQVVLQGGTDPYIPNRAVAIAIAMHLVGDTSQPLHCATHWFYSYGQWRNDAGGNREYVLNGPPGDAHFSLHNFWDFAWRASFDPSTGNIVIDPAYDEHGGHDPGSIRTVADHLAPPTFVEADPFDFEAWARNSNKYARTFVYPGITTTENKKYCRLGSSYVAQAQKLALSQLSLAAVRLAALLNATVGADHPGPPPASYPAGPPTINYGP